VSTNAYLYSAVADGKAHTYRFFTEGQDANGNIEAPPNTPDVTVSGTFAHPSELAVTGFDVNRTTNGRSFVRYVDLIFNQADATDNNVLTGLVQNGAITLTKYPLSGPVYDANGVATNGTPVTLLPSNFRVIDYAIEIDFGALGLGGTPSTAAANGYYELSAKLSLTKTVRADFYRLLGDADGSKKVDSADVTLVSNATGQSTVDPTLRTGPDINGDGVVNATDKTLAQLNLNQELGKGKDGKYLPLGLQ
jgi:hypothetical protein